MNKEEGTYERQLTEHFLDTGGKLISTGLVSNNHESVVARRFYFLGGIPKIRMYVQCDIGPCIKQLTQYPNTFIIRNEEMNGSYT